jgi:hypothetical protein
MAKLYDIKLTSANAPDALFTVYYNSVNSATIAEFEYLIIILQLT